MSGKLLQDHWSSGFILQYFTTILFISLWGEGLDVHCIVSSCSLFNVLYNNRFARQTSGL